MKVILTKNVEKIGKTGDVIDAKDGYARNFLIPKGLATLSTAQNLRIVENLKIKAQRVVEKEKLAAQEFADKLSKVSCTVSVQVGPDEKLYGSVTPADIQQALETEGFKVDKKMIAVDSSIDKVGVYSASVSVHPEIKANVKVWIVKK